MIYASKTAKHCRHLFAWKTVIAALFFVACAHGAEIDDRFSAFELAMDQIATRDGQDVDLALSKLMTIEAQAVTVAERAALAAYRCVLYSKLKQSKNIENTIAALEFNFPHRDPAAQAAVSLCKAYFGLDDKEFYVQTSIGFNLVKSIAAPTLRYWLATNYIEYVKSQGRLRDALEAAQIALSVAQKNNSEKRLVITLASLSLIESSLGNNTVALRYNDDAIAIAKRPESKSRLVELLLNRGYFLAALKRFDEAHQAYESAIANASTQDVGYITAIAWSNYADIALEENRYHEALRYGNLTAEWANKNGDVELKSFGMISGAIAELHIGDARHAQQQFDNGVYYFKDKNQVTELRDFYERWSKHLALTKRYELAYKAVSQQNLYILEFEKQSRTYVAEELHEILKNEKREKMLATLQADNLKNEATILQERQRRENWIAAALIISLLTVWVARIAWRAHKHSQSLKQENQLLDTQRYRDALTGLNNRHFWIDNQSKYESVQPEDNAQHAALLFVLDVDHFKRINDGYGHAGGDEVLREVAKRIRHCLRESDVVVRWGGEEILVFSSNVMIDSIPLMVRRMLNAFTQAPVHFEQRDIAISTSIGYVQIPQLFPSVEKVSLDDYLLLADACLYLAKSHGRNCAIGLKTVSPRCKHTPTSLASTMMSAWYDGEVEMNVTAGNPAKALKRSANRDDP